MWKLFLSKLFLIAISIQCFTSGFSTGGMLSLYCIPVLIAVIGMLSAFR